MSSPFPGMDPYIEPASLWGDFHTSMLTAMRAALNHQLPKGYIASVELYVWTPPRGTSGRRQKLGPDVYVREESQQPHEMTTVATLEAPATIVLPAPASKKRRFLKIVDSRTRRVVTVIELLSPANKKPGDDRNTYLAKRREYLANKLSFVEIDLLRAGKRPPLGTPPLEITDYYAMVCRGWEHPRAGMWTFSLRDPLPEIPVPVTEDQPDIPLQLRPCFDRTYDEGRYHESLPYDEPLKPKVSKNDLGWVQKLLSQGHVANQ